MEYVVRFSEFDHDFRKDQFAVRFATPHLPIPRIVEAGEAFAGYFAIAPRARGEYLDALDADRVQHVVPSLVQGISKADLSGTSGFGMWDATGEAPHSTWRDALLAMATDVPGSRISGWRGKLEQSPTGAEPFDTAYAALRDLSTQLPNERHLVHADLLNYNVLVEGERVSAVLDWGNAMFGDWVFDVAWFVFWQPWYPAWSGIDFTQGFDGPDFAVRLRCCMLAIGLDNQAYCAYKGESRWPQLDEVARLTLALAE
jgi:hygromycin-B 4-O-kinase